MRIAYVCYWFLLDRDGVANKISAQVARWRAEGHEVQVFCLARANPSVSSSELDWHVVPFETPLGRLTGTRRLVRDVEAWRPDAVYLRYDLFLPPLHGLLRRVGTVIEINSDDREEAKLRVDRARLASAYNELNRRLLIGRSKGLVCVTHELERSPSFAPFRKPTTVIANGVDLDALRPLPPAVGERPAVAFLGSVRQVWHGVDKLAWLARETPSLDFHVVGYDEHWLRDAIRGEVPANMIAHGPLSRAEFEPVLARCDAAFGTLALHRKNMTEACPLKVREYLGYGLPVVISYEDTDLVGVDAWWLERIPNTEDNVRSHAESLRAFVASVRGRRVPRDEIVERVGTVAKERRRLEFISGEAAT